MAVRKKSKSFKATFMLVAVICIGLIIVRWAYSNYQSSKQAQGMLDQVERREHAIETRLEQAQARNELLETDTGVQDFLIEKYAVKRTGERVLVLVKDENERVVESEKEEVGLWKRMGQIFFE